VKLFLLFFTQIALTMFMLSPISASQYPDKPVKIVIGYPPGGGTDVLGRYIFSKIAERTGKTIIIENLSGATGIIGTRHVSSSDPDGYTLLLGHISPNAINPGDFFLPRSPPDWNVLPVARIATAPSLLLVRPETKIRTLIDFKKWLRSNPDTFYGSDGIGSLAHLQMVNLLAGRTRDPIHIPYKGGAPALQAIMSNDIPIMFSPLPVALGLMSSDKFTIIAQTGEKRSAILSNLPTMAEQGEPDFVAVLWWGLFSPVGVSTDIRKYWEIELSKTLSQPDVIEWLNKYGYTAAFLSSSVFTQYVESEKMKWVSVIKNIH